MNPDPPGSSLSCLPWHAIFLVYLHLFSFRFFFVCLSEFIYLKKLQHNTIMHRESKALFPNTAPLCLALGPVKSSILSEAFLHIPASQERKALLCRALNLWKSNSFTQDTCTASTSPQAPSLCSYPAFAATTSKVLFGNCPIPFPSFHTRYHVCTKGDYAILNK